MADDEANDAEQQQVNESQGPLSGVRVIDFTSIYSGPIGTAILGDQGADVIKIEAADGDLMRRGHPENRSLSAAFAMMNRNKRSVWSMPGPMRAGSPARSDPRRGCRDRKFPAWRDGSSWHRLRSL